MTQWGNKEAAEEYKPKGGSGFWGKLEEGDNKLRLVSDYKYIGYHWQGMGKPSVVCLNNAEPYPKSDKCALCRQKKEVNGKQYPNSPSPKFVVNCIDLSDTKDLAIRHYEFPYAVIDAINGYALDPDYKFENLPEWDMIITKETKGEKKVDYKVRAARKNRPLSETEKELMEEFESPEDVVKFKLEKAAEEQGEIESQNAQADEVVSPDNIEDEKSEQEKFADEVNLDDIPF